ncbi:MAG: hypothetical protein ACO1OB_27135 [Archangium sp.]
MSPLNALSSVWRQVRPKADLSAASQELAQALRSGMTLCEALTATAPTLAKVAVREASDKFDGGALALFIVDVRDSLKRQLLEASQLVMDAPMSGALRFAARGVNGDTFVQHLINSLLAATELYVESMPLESVNESGCTRAVSELFTRSLCVLVTRNDAIRRCGQGGRAQRVEFIPLPQPSPRV